MTRAPEPQPNCAARHHNRLLYEKSPYLLQHAHNPVDWYPWGTEAFARARRENKPIFLSIGYSTCHWCHVMERESFEDAQVAGLMNDAFVNIKVDREERPDIDDLYMTVAQMMTVRGGWPLNIIMTPDKVPFFAATYIPKDSRFGQVGLLTLIPAIKQRWQTSRSELLNVSSQVTEALQRSTRTELGGDLSEDTLRLAFHQLSQRFDARNGGFGHAPKFPTPHNLLFLLRYWKRTADETALHMVEQTLQAMRRGGLFDHLGFGFHRYSTDAQWLLPHFEKMLYDQALLAMAYTEAFQATGNDDYRQTAEEILAYVLRDMTHPLGGFYSAEDADSEGQEGKFYLWTRAELSDVLGGEEAALISRVFGVQPGGNFSEEASGQSTGSNILYLKEPLGQVAGELGMTEEQLVERVEAARAKLFAHRDQRVHPLKDDKVLTDWNGLMIAALAKAARAFDDSCYAESAARAAGFVLEHLVRDDGRLLHRFRDDEAALLAYAADYAFLTWGLLELYETTFSVQDLEQSVSLNADLIKLFWDEQNGGFYSTGDDSEQLLVRRKEIYDGAVPSANSVATWNLLHIARITGDVDLERKAAQISRAFSKSVGQLPQAHAQLMIAVDFGLGPSREVVIVGKPGADDTAAMLRALRRPYLPSKVVLFRPEGLAADIVRLAEFTQHQRSLNGRATAYVCRNHSCQLPTTDIETMLRLLDAAEGE